MDPTTMDDPYLNTRKLSKRSRDIIYKEFQSFDKDKDGYVTLEEAIDVLNKRFGFAPDKTKRMLQKCDRNGDKQLSYDEFVEFYFRVDENISQMQSYFHETDRDHNGVIDPTEAKKLMRQMAFNDEEINTMLSVCDVNGDGNLNYEEFLRFWRK